MGMLQVRAAEQAISKQQQQQSDVGVNCKI
jgi:hypothetical protein